MRGGNRAIGFTVVEVLIVMAVIGVLASLVVVGYRNMQGIAKGTAARSEYTQMSEQIESFTARNTYPGSISDCPNPAAANICIQPKSGQTLRYYAYTTSAPRFSATHNTVSVPSYELEVRNADGFYYGSNAEVTSTTSEFVQYMDMAPIINQYGLRKYKISFDIKSANITNRNTVTVYMQNGLGARYSFYSDVPVTLNFVRQSVIVTPTGPDAAFTQSVLAFYGTYSTGNIPTIKNVEIAPAW